MRDRPQGGSVHPRVCGEQLFAKFIGLQIAGSSPRVRGTASESPPADNSVRFIPACAGNSKLPGMPDGIGAVHPRVCGEQVKFGRLRFRGLGSSPRVRGTARFAYICIFNRRFIPACAGNSSASAAFVASAAVHPRVCGEQSTRFLNAPSLHGSSPRVRGTDLTDLFADLETRFIPACAGNRVSTRYCFSINLPALRNLPIVFRCIQPDSCIFFRVF